MPGGASLYSLSVAWVSSCEALAPKRVLRCSMALFCLLPSHFQASENLVNKGVQKAPLLFYAPILVFEWGQCYTGHFVLYIMDPIQIIANIYFTQTKKMRF